MVLSAAHKTTALTAGRMRPVRGMACTTRTLPFLCAILVAGDSTTFCEPLSARRLVAATHDRR
ncbi:hypothetical protein XPE_04965 [Xanthomonas perforans 91-118]|nr:hypothetical protein XPE_04965 [Xanthomonas perforans 91-118]